MKFLKPNYEGYFGDGGGMGGSYTTSATPRVRLWELRQHRQNDQGAAWWRRWFG